MDTKRPQVAAIYNMLERFRLELYYNKFLEMGVRDERDFLDSVTEEDLNNMGFTQVEKNRFENVKDQARRLTAPVHHLQSPATVQKTLEEFCIQYTFPQCPEPKYIRGLDPAENTVEDLMLRMCHLESVGNAKGVCLYTVEGMPLTDDPFFNTWSLKDRHINNKDQLYAIFTPVENLKKTPLMKKATVKVMSGDDMVRCHIMLRGDFEVLVNLDTDTIANLRCKLANESGIPSHVLHYQGQHVGGDILHNCGISEGSTVNFSLSTFHEEISNRFAFFCNDVEPSVQQTTKGRSVFLSSLYTVKRHNCGERFKKVIAYIRKLTGCHPLAQSLYQLICKNMICTRIQKIAVVEGLYTLFRELLPRPGKRQAEKTIEDVDVFEYSMHCWAYLISEAENESIAHENYAPQSLTEQGIRFCDPVTVPGLPDVFERAYVLQKIRDGENIPNCSVALQETSLKRATDIEKILLSLPPSTKTYPLWLSHDVAGQNFQVRMEKTFADMSDKQKTFPYLIVVPPLVLRSQAVDGLLVLLSEDNLGVCLMKDKGSPEMVWVFDFISGQEKMTDLEELAAKTGSHTNDHTFITCRIPKEAILVLMDTSSSMDEECYGDLNMKKIDAVKELFDNFATRTMAYDFHHVIGLVRFSSEIKIIHTFTEILENFKDHLHKLQTSGCTILYDALRRGEKELVKVKERFPDCRLRIICLTDGNDSGSSVNPETVAVNLIKSNIIVDSILIGDMDNNTLHGISNATGGCCFNPKTSMEGLKLFEIETVLSLEMRKAKAKLEVSSITSENVLRDIFARHGYDEFPETSLPSEFSSKVTVTENALKKKIQESSTFMEKDKRILQELRSMHCDPHPYFTIFPSESDFTFWKILMQGPPETPYENGVFELYCKFGDDYPVKPPTLRFVTRVYHCNINNSGRICHNIFDRNYNAHITMREILDAIYGLLIIPEAEDPLDSILAEEFLSSREKYQQEAKKHTKETAGKSLDDMEQELVGLCSVTQYTPPHLICPLTKRMFVDPVKTKYGTVYERKAIEDHLKVQVS